MGDAKPSAASAPLTRYVHHVRVELPVATETVAEARQRLGDKFPRPALRRMTHLGLLLGSVLDGVTLSPEDAVVYASTFAETRALEDYLASFPTASPALFQTSIHPGAVQQVCISRQQSVARLWPLAGRSRLVEQAIVTVLLESAPRVVLLGGEERGTWMLDHGMANPRSFGFGLLLSHDATGAIGRVTLTRSASAAAETCPDLIAFAEALAAGRTLRWRSDVGKIALEFS